MSNARRFPIVAALLLVLSALTPVLVGAVTPADAASKTKCSGWHSDPKTKTNYRYCIQVTKIKPVVKQDGNYLLHNSDRRQTVKGTCAWDHSTTWTWKLEGTVKAEAGLIFSKVSAEVTTGVQHSTTDSTQLGFSFKLKPGKWAYCARGHVGYIVSGYTRKEVCGTKCFTQYNHDFSGRIPASSFLEYGPGKHIDWSQFLPKA